jgi:dihydrodipicolinate synthase/N-acetylneuraminate lyase
VVALGSLGEGATLTSVEKKQVLDTCVQAIGGRAFVVAGVSALSTAEAVSIARMAEAAGCHGLMVLPPYVYVGDWREMRAHVSAVLEATPLSAMLYNNPIAYTVDYLFNFALQGEKEKAFQIYRWFLPLLRMDTVPKFVQLIKLVQESVGMGSARVRPPRLGLIGRELDEAKTVLKEALVNRERG